MDGRVTNYFEWLGAGVYTPDYRSGSMHGGEEALEALYYGHNDHALYVRLDLNERFLSQFPQFEIRINIDGEGRARLHATVGRGGLGLVQFWKHDEQVLFPLGTGDSLKVGFERIFELQMDYKLIGVATGEKVRLHVSVWAEDLPLQVVPAEGWLTLELAADLVSW